MNNIPEFSVTEFSNLAKNILEENFSLIRVRGEISSVKNFKGHLYFTIKDENLELEKSIYLGGKKILDNTCITISGNLVNKDKFFNWEVKKKI